MTASRRCGVIVAVVLTLAARGVLADPTPAPAPTVVVAPPLPGTLHLQTPSTVVTDGGSNLRLPPGYWMDEPTYKRQDDDLKVLQDKDTRLTVENQSLRQSVSGWQPGWKMILSAVVTGLAAGIYLGHKI